MSRKDSLRDRVYLVLQNSEDSRNSDVILWLKVLDLSGYRTKKMIDTDGSSKVVIPLEGLSIKQSDVQRIRAMIQNKKHQFLPTYEEVRKARKISEEEWEGWIRNQ